MKLDKRKRNVLYDMMVIKYRMSTPTQRVQTLNTQNCSHNQLTLLFNMQKFGAASQISPRLRFLYIVIEAVFIIA